MEKLSEDVWINIFDLLSSKDIENAAISCENWRNIITTTPSLMRKLSINIDIEEVEGKPWMKLPYKNLYLQHIRDSDSDVMNQINNDIELRAGTQKILVKFSNFIDIVKVLNKFQNITTLVAQQLSGWDKRDNTKIDLPNLTHLKIETRAIWLLPKIRCHKIEVLYATFCENLTKKREKDFGLFLQNCEKLKHLTIKNVYTDEIMKIKSQLETFEQIGVCKTLPSSFLQLLKFQQSSLKNLTLDVYEFDDEIANFIYFQMNLDKLVDCRLRHGQIQDLKKVLVKNLAIRSQNEKFEYFENLFQFCEMLEVLDFDLPEKRALEFLGLLSNLPKLKYLKLRGYSKERFEPTFKINRLERLILSENFTADQCVKIIRCCLSLTHIRTFKTFTKNEFENIFQDCNKIQEIYLFSSFQKFTDEDFETYKDVGSKIKVKIETCNKDVIEKLSNVKNRMTVIPEQTQLRDPFLVRPKILSHLYYDYSDDNQRDYLEVDEFDYYGGYSS